MLNGDGLRTVLWVAGCSHRCDGCQNPITWDVCGGIEFTDTAMDELISSMDNDWCSGLTLSGGDPLHEANRETTLMICKVVKRIYPTKSIWVYTGYNWEDISDLPIMGYVDVVVDGKFDKTKLDATYPWAGSVNQRVIDVPKSLASKLVILHCGA